MSKLISLDSLRVVLQKVKNALTVLNNSISTKEQELKEYVDSKTADINVSTPDWNAKEGEDGYIKNRTHFFNATSTVSPMAWEIDNTSLPKKATVNLSEDYIYMFEYNNNTYYIKTNTDKDTNKKLVDSGALSIYYKYVSGKHTIEIRYYSQDLTNTFLVIHEQSISSAISLGYLKQLDDIFILDTIARKTDVEGFDPVVWKYLCDPYIITVDTPIPEEVHSMIFDEDLGIKPICLKTILFDNVGSIESPISYGFGYIRFTGTQQELEYDYYNRIFYTM